MGLYISKFNKYKRNKIDLLIKDQDSLVNSIGQINLDHIYSIGVIIDTIDESLLSFLSDFLLDKELLIILFVNDDLIINNNLSLLNKYHCYIKGQYKTSFEFIKPLGAPRPIRINKGFEGEIHCPDGKKIYKKKSLSPINLEESFKDKLFKYLNKCNKENNEVYTAGGITRQVFSKIISIDSYIPKKPTIICLAIGMELNIDETLDLLNSAGYTLSNSLRFDKIVRSFIMDRDYNLLEINAALDKYGEQILGWCPREN